MHGTASDSAGPQLGVGPQLGEPAVWDMDSPDYECDCPGPPAPPQFHMPPPPRPSFLIDADCSEHPISDLETCQAVPVIDAEYHSSPAIPSLAVIVIIVVAVMVFFSIVTVLVVWKKRKMQNFLPRKASPQNHCDPSTANGVIYEDLTNIRPRALPHCPPGQIEMMDVNAFPNHAGFSSVFICPSSVPDSYNSQDLFNPVYEELSNGSGDRGETDSEGVPQAPVSEDEFAEDELSLGGEVEAPQDLERRSGRSGRSGSSSLQGSTGNDLCRDVDSSDADDRSRFLVNPSRNFSLPPGYRDKERRSGRGSHPHHSATDRRPKSLDRRRGWRSKVPPPVPQPPPDRSEFHEGFLLDTLLQLYPNVAVGSSTRHRPPGYPVEPPHPALPGAGCGNVYETVPALSHLHGHHPRQEIFTTFRATQNQGKNQSQDSSFGSDSGYSNNTSGGRTSSRGRKDQRLSSHADLVLS